MGNPIKQFRDSINKNNIAFFSYDKRTANKNNLNSYYSTEYPLSEELIKTVVTFVRK